MSIPTYYDLQVENWALQEELEEARETADTNFARVESQAAHIERLRQEVRAKDLILNRIIADKEALARNAVDLEIKVSALDAALLIYRRENKVLVEKRGSLEARVGLLEDWLDSSRGENKALAEKSKKVEAESISLHWALGSMRRRLRELDDGVEVLRSAVVPSKREGGGFRLEVKTGYRAIEGLLHAVGRERATRFDSGAPRATSGIGGSLITEAGDQSTPVDRRGESEATTDQSSSTRSTSIESPAAGRHERFQPSTLQELHEQHRRISGNRTIARGPEAAAPKEPSFSQPGATTYVQPARKRHTEEGRAIFDTRGLIPTQGGGNPTQPSSHGPLHF